MTTEQKIAEVDAAIHDLMTGKQVRVFVDQNGERVEFNRAGLSSLQAYLATLRSASPNVGPIGFFF